MKRSLSFSVGALALPAAGLVLVAATYGLVRLAYGLLLPDVQHDLGIATPAAGAISAGASAVYCVGAVVGFALASRRPRTLVVLAGVAAALGALGTAVAGDGASFAVAAVAASSGAGLASPALVALLSADRATRTRPRMQAVVNAGTGPGLVVAAVLALVLDDWRTVWGVAAVIAAVAAVAVLAAHREDVGHETAGPAPAASPAWLRAHGAVVAAALLMGVASAATWSFGRTILVEAGAHEATSLGAWIALGVGGALAVASAGPLDALGPRPAWAATVATLAAATLALALAPASTIVAVAACAAFGWGYTAGSGVLIAWTGAIDARRAASGTAMLFVVLVLGQAIGAAIVGAAAPLVGLGSAFVAAAVVACLAIAAASTPWARVPERADWSA